MQEKKPFCQEILESVICFPNGAGRSFYVLQKAFPLICCEGFLSRRDLMLFEISGFLLSNRRGDIQGCLRDAHYLLSSGALLTRGESKIRAQDSPHHEWHQTEDLLRSMQTLLSG